jgi:hypothetical protein
MALKGVVSAVFPWVFWGEYFVTVYYIYMYYHMGKPMSMFMCFINLYHVQNILCKGHHSVSNIL